VVVLVEDAAESITSLTNTFALLRLLPMSDRDKDIEILALRHQIEVLHRQLGDTRVRFTPADRALLAALVHRLPRQTLHKLRLLVRPDTILRWHRDLLRRHHASMSRPKHPGRPRTIRSIRHDDCASPASPNTGDRLLSPKPCHDDGAPRPQRSPFLTTHAPPFAIGPGNTAVATFIDPRNGEEIYVTRTSAPALPPVEYQMYMELQRMGVRGEDVKALHTDLSPSDLPGGYTLSFVSGAFPNAALSCSHNYGQKPDERAKAVEALVQQVAMTNQLVGQQPPPPPFRAPVPTGIPAAWSVPDQALGGHLVQVFGPQGVRRYDARNTRLPEAAKATLGWAGLPADIPFFFTADTPDNPPPGGFLTDAATYMRAVGTKASDGALGVLGGHVRIGSDGACAITVQCDDPEFMPTGPGQVWSIPPRDAMGRRVNATLSAFVRSLTALAVTRQRMAGLDPFAAGAAVAALQHELAAIDATALDDPGNWWSVILEQMWHGLF
jgi:hypothetical protein